MRCAYLSSRVSTPATGRSHTRSPWGSGYAPSGRNSRQARLVLLDELARDGPPPAVRRVIQKQRGTTGEQHRLGMLAADCDHVVGRELHLAAVGEEALDAGRHEHRSRLIADELAKAIQLEKAAVRAAAPQS